jgi:hypothetical protein
MERSVRREEALNKKIARWFYDLDTNSIITSVQINKVL